MLNDIAVKAMTTDALAVLSPDEVFLIDHFDLAKNKPGAVAKGPQGFGASEAIALLLPVLYSFFSKFVEAMGTEAGKKTLGALTEYITRKDPKKKVEAELEVRQALIEAGMPEAKLSESVDTVLAILAKRM